MPILGNRSVLHKSPGRFISGREAVLRSGFNKHGMMRGAYGSYDAKSATPNGHLAPSAWVPPKTAGGMSSRNVTGLSVGLAGLAVGGITTDAAASISISFADASGELISSGSGTAVMTFTVADALLTASLDGIGAASFVINPSPALLGAKAGAIGSASFSISGSLTPYAIGSMSGSTADSGVLTAESIVAAINASVPNVNIKKINDVTIQGAGVPGNSMRPV